MISRTCTVLSIIVAATCCMTLTVAFAPATGRISGMAAAATTTRFSQQTPSRLYSVAPPKGEEMTKEEQMKFDKLVNKNEQGARQDNEEYSERLSLDITKTVYTQLVKSPPDAYITFAEKGASNAHLPKRKIFHQSVLGGCYVGFGGLISLLIAGNIGGLSGANPGIAKMAFAALFPVNLLLIISTQGQLFTGNSATVAAAKFEGFVTWTDLWTNWSISLLGNIFGCVLFAGGAMLAKVMNPGATALAISTTTAKCSAGWVATLIRAIMCNWMVSMAVFLGGAAANDLTGKMVGCWFPISTFVGIGLEHSVANMFILPLGLMLGAGLGIGTIITKNLIPVIIGNGIAGALIVAASYSFQFGRLGGLQRALFKEKLSNIQKQLAIQRQASDAQLQADLDAAEN